MYALLYGQGATTPRWWESYDLKAWMSGVARQFEREGYAVTGSLRDRSVVHSGWPRFRRVLYDVGLSPHRDEVVGIRPVTR